MTTSFYETCVERVDAAGLDNAERQEELLRCVAESIDEAKVDLADGTNTFFLIYASSLVFFMQAGFAMLCAGSVRIKNVQNTMLKNLLDACGAGLGFYSVGYAFAYGGSDPTSPDKTFIGNTNFFLMDVDNEVFWLFQFAFAATAATIVAGTLAERCQMTAYLCYSVMLTGFVYPVVAHSIWSANGFLSASNVDPLWGSGVVDFAGSGVVHMTGGITALIATYILGARKGRFYDLRGNKLDKPKPFPGHSMALQMLGAFILWFGWYGFNTGSALSITSTEKAAVASIAAINTTLAASAACVSALFSNLFIAERMTGEATFSLTYAMNGTLGGLVSITAGCAVFEPWAAIITGLMAGLIYLLWSHGLVRLCLDDAVDAIPVHFANGMWGLISVGLFAAPDRMERAYGTAKHVGWFYSWGRGSGDATLLACQIVGVLFIVGWITLLMLPFFCLLNYLGWFRADSLEEIVGLDISYHGGTVSANNTFDEIKPEYVDAYNKRKNELRNRRTTGGKMKPVSDYTAEFTTGDSSDIEDTVDRVVP